MPANPAQPAPATLTAAEVRRRFISFFEARAHRFVPSSTTVPMDDPSLRDTFANAGMNQFKPIFLGQLPPNSPLSGVTRAVNTQKCIRAGGKHNDLDDVGKDTYHHTFFEMLGNWSFGDYFKADAIAWAFEFLTKDMGLDPARLYATYFGGDRDMALDADLEARDLWRKYLPPERVLPGSMKDNFWEMGDTGPCGPCSELHYDRIGNRDAAALVNADDPMVIEIWNLVFIQFDRLESGKLRPLPAKHVDTGMGFERLCSIIQGKTSNYDIDLFAPLFAAIQKLTGARPYAGKLGPEDEGGVDEAYRVIADHARTLTFALTDGAVPSNEGRGYVLRRILRRAVRYGRQKLNAPSGFFAKLVPVVVDTMSEAFPELRTRPEEVIRLVAEEEQSFERTLDRGINMFEDIATTAGREAMIRSVNEGDGDANSYVIKFLHDRGEMQKNYGPDSVDWREYQGQFRPVILGDEAFKLYDTYGFPIDLTLLMADERGIKVDIPGFERATAEQKERSRASGRKDATTDKLALSAEETAKLAHLKVSPTDDGHKFEPREMRARVKAIWDGRTFEEHADTGTHGHKPVAVVLDKTCFYAEMGGQVCDHGRITSAKGAEVRVEDVRSYAGYVVHAGPVVKGRLTVGDEVVLHVDANRRKSIAANHTATHVVNHKLRTVLGGSPDQKGSLVAPDRLRFDFAHHQPVTPDELREVERMVRDDIEADLPVHAAPAALYVAQGIAGVRAVFGETYPDPVRVVSIGASTDDLMGDPENQRWTGYSVEFCGGTHLASTGLADAFCLVSEEGIAKGVRRITALTGVPARAAIQAGDSMEQQIRAAASLPDADLGAAVTELTNELDQLTMSAPRKAGLRDLLGQLTERVKQADKLAAHARAAAAEQQARQIASAAAASMEHVIVNTIDAGSDRKALEAAANTIASACPSSAVMLFAADELDGKASIIALVPKPLIDRGLKAGDWVRHAAAVMGGKGGGRPESAQGGGTDLAKLRDAIKAARTLAHEKLG
ncbi:MAG: alanine--tRNA ligase [Phycisphaerales bacterium]